LAALTLCPPVPGASPTKKQVAACVTEVAQRLGNTPAISRKCYIHPHVIEAYLEGGLTGELEVRRILKRPGGDRLNAEERAVLAFLERRARRATGHRNGAVNGRGPRRAAAAPA
jgi:DNA topoisomerase IB